MIDRLTPAGYAQTKVKLANTEARLAALRARGDLSATHKGEVERSYLDMISQYRREIKLYEATAAQSSPARKAGSSSVEAHNGGTEASECLPPNNPP
jgi:hypothetical protein